MTAVVGDRSRPDQHAGLNDRTDIDLGKMPGPVMSVDKLVAIGLEGLAKNKSLVIAGGANRLMDFMFRRVMPLQAGRHMMGMMTGERRSDPLGPTDPS